MATHRAKCPKCGEQFDADGAPGGQVTCPNCAATLRVPGRAKPTAPTDPLIGQTLGEFEILGFLGRGGMGAVYKARQPSLDRMVALKVLPQRVAGDESFVERFNREARSAAAVRHPNIIEVHAIGQDKGHSYIAMEFIEGETLAKVLKREGRLAPDRALEVMKQVTSALARAHGAKILHRDIKPSNILLDETGWAKVADFGLAKHEGVDVTLTAAGAALGTPLYIAPEAARGTKLDARSDLYSLGATFYHVLAGRPPFEGMTGAELILKHAEQRASPLQDLAPDAPPALCRIIHRLLRKNAADRYESAEALLEALNRVEAGLVGGAPGRRSTAEGGSLPRVRPSPSQATATLPPDARPKRATTARKRGVGGASLPRVLPRWLWASGGIAAALLILILLLILIPRSKQPPPKAAVPPSSPKPGTQHLAPSPKAVAAALKPTPQPPKPGTQHPAPPPPRPPKPEPPPEPKAAPWKVYTQWPFDAAEAKRRQTETAKALGLPAEQDIDLGNGAKMAFVLIPAGEFLMGSPPNSSPEQLAKVHGGEVELYQREFPQHRVRITRPFWMGKSEVTQEQWQAIMGANPSHFKGPERPVEKVSWNACRDFAAKLSKKAKRTLSLPSGAEWEYACRAGSATEYSFREPEAGLGEYGWHFANSSRVSHDVGQKKPNHWGLFDMHGNVWEWCEDVWHGTYDGGAPTDGSAWTEGGNQGLRVLRSGSWLFNPSHCRSAFRTWNTPSSEIFDYGCRMVLRGF